MNGLALKQAVVAVTKAWRRKRKAEDRDAIKRVDYYRRPKKSLKDAAYEIMEAAYLKASGNGTLPANARQIMYAARGPILEATGKASLDSQYFTQTLLPGFVREHPELTAEWRIAYDARGNFMEPHAAGDAAVRLGTLEVDRYISGIGMHASPLSQPSHSAISSGFPTSGPENRFGAVLFIEKEGFWPILEAAQIAERYDLAMLSTKGQSNVASRRLIDRLCGDGGIPLLTLHDFDVAGMSIAAVLGRDNQRYEWEHEIRHIDLGLRLEDVQAHSLQSEPCRFRAADRARLKQDGASDDEVAYLGERQRVELNAFTSDQFIAWLEGKLQQHGVSKVIPDSETLEIAYRRAVAARRIDARINAVETEELAAAKESTVPANLADRVHAVVASSPERPWDQAVWRIAAEESTGLGPRGVQQHSD